MTVKYLRFEKKHPDAMLPMKGFSDDAGFDLAVVEDEWFEPGDTRILPLGVAVWLGWGEWGLLTGRSSTLTRYDLMVYPGVIDSGYQGELKAVIRNLGGATQLIRAGTRLVQLVPMVNQSIGREPFWVNPEGSAGSGRGSDGFGSTG